MAIRTAITHLKDIEGCNICSTALSHTVTLQECLSLIVDCGADLNASDKRGWTVLPAWACYLCITMRDQSSSFIARMKRGGIAS